MGGLLANRDGGSSWGVGYQIETVPVSGDD